MTTRKYSSIEVDKEVIANRAERIPTACAVLIARACRESRRSTVLQFSRQELDLLIEELVIKFRHFMQTVPWLLSVLSGFRV